MRDPESIRRMIETRKRLGPRYPLSDVPKVGLQRHMASGGVLQRRRQVVGRAHPTKDSPGS